jgi:hypothetical protein
MSIDAVSATFSVGEVLHSPGYLTPTSVVKNVATTHHRSPSPKALTRSRYRDFAPKSDTRFRNAMLGTEKMPHHALSSHHIVNMDYSDSAIFKFSVLTGRS